MKSLIFKLLFLGAFLHVNMQISANKVIWQIGVPDGNTIEFSLSPSRYKDFLKYDFGWEDRFYLIGYSSSEKDFPYVLPGPEDSWGGTGPTSGIHTPVLNILFGINHFSQGGKLKLIIDVLDTHPEKPPVFKVIFNNKSWKFQLKNGGDGGSLEGNFNKTVKQTIEIPIEANILQTGGNQIVLSNLEGSWLIFDDIRLEGSDDVQLQLPGNTAFLRSVRPANYEIEKDSCHFQPLLVDVEHLSKQPLLTVLLDEKSIFEQSLEEGRYVFEAPMPEVTTPKQSNYTILLDGKIIEQGTIQRSQRQPVTPADYVETRMGTAHSRWMIAPGPWMPFSMVKLSPDNQNSGWQAGYDPSFESVGTFSHIHEWTMAGLGIMPVNGPLRIRIGDQSKPDAGGYRSQIDKSSEEAPLGYYKVDLTDYHIQAELTATTRCGFQRTTYPKRTDSRIMIDLKIPAEYRYDIKEFELRQMNDYRVEGYSVQQSKNVWSTDADQDYTIHFVIEFDRPIKKIGCWMNDSVIYSNYCHGENPKKAGCFVEFDTRQNPIVQVRSGISYVDMEGARLNLKTEITDPFGWDFDAVRHHQCETWNRILGRLAVESNDRREKIRFYTNVYRAFCRNTFSDADGRWMDATHIKQRFSDPDALALGCDAFWNTFWNLNQVWNLIAPEWSSRWVKSQLAMYDANGWLAKGPAGMKYIPVMVAEHEIPLLVSAYQMGIRNFDAGKLLTAVKKMQTTLPSKVGNGFAGNRDLSAYLTYHFVPADKGRFSNTLEYSFDDWAVSQLAKALNKESDYQLFADRGTWWKNSISPVSGYAHLRYSDGSWEKNFDPFKSGANDKYVEGNAWQLTYFVPQNVPALAEYIGKDRFIDRLTWGFEVSEPWRYNAPGDQYWDFPVVQGNEQSMHFAFLFNWVGQPWQTQRWSRSILSRYYGYDIANAYLGDEDQGQMSAWFVMAALGLFQTDGGCRVDPVYEITAPLFEKVTIDLGEQFGRGKSFIIEAKNVSRKNKYIQSALLNGKPLESFFFPAKSLLQGGKLELVMASEPNENRGIKPAP